MKQTAKVNAVAKNRIVRDLTEKYPKGPYGLFRKEHYQEVRIWSDAYRKYVDTRALSPGMIGRLRVTEDNAKHFGYEPLELFKLGASSEDSAKELIKSLYPDLKGAGVTRRARLLWTRVKGAVQMIMRDGTEGIWSCSSYRADYGSLWRGMEIYGVDRADVEAQVRLIGPMTGLSPDWPVDIKFTRLGTREEATESAAKRATTRVNRIKSDIETYRAHIARAEKDLEEAILEMNKSLGGVMLLSGTNDDEQEVAE